jgi:hypothetical protein
MCFLFPTFFHTQLQLTNSALHIVVTVQWLYTTVLFGCPTVMAQVFCSDLQLHSFINLFVENNNNPFQVMLQQDTEFVIDHITPIKIERNLFSYFKLMKIA